MQAGTTDTVAGPSGEGRPDAVAGPSGEGRPDAVAGPSGEARPDAVAGPSGEGRPDAVAGPNASAGQNLFHLFNFLYHIVVHNNLGKSLIPHVATVGTNVFFLFSETDT